MSITACMQRPRSRCVLGVRLITNVVGLTQGRPPSSAIRGVHFCHQHQHPFTVPICRLGTDSGMLFVNVLCHAGAIPSWCISPTLVDQGQGAAACALLAFGGEAGTDMRRLCPYVLYACHMACGATWRHELPSSMGVLALTGSVSRPSTALGRVMKPTSSEGRLTLAVDCATG